VVLLVIWSRNEGTGNDEAPGLSSRGFGVTGVSAPGESPASSCSSLRAACLSG
jgi:hypothetical protein